MGKIREDGKPAYKRKKAIAQSIPDYAKPDGYEGTRTQKIQKAVMRINARLSDMGIKRKHKGPKDGY